MIAPNGGPIHVLVVTNHQEGKTKLPYAGVFVDREVDSLKRAGIQVSVFDIGSSHHPLKILRRWLDLRQQARCLKPNVLHGQYGTIVGFLTTLTGSPAVVSFCGSDLLPGASVSYIRMRLGFVLSNLAALRARRVICKSEELRQALWWRRAQAVVIPNGVDLDLFSPGSQSVARQELGWRLDHPVVLFNGGRDPKNKGLDLAQSAMQVAQSRVPNAELHILTNVKPGLMPLYYRAADVLLCASRQEGSPNVVKEALACNLPVVSTGVGDIRERLSGVRPSAIVPRAPEPMGEALVDVMLTRTRSNGREHVADLSLERVAQRVLAVYQSVSKFAH